MDRIADRLLIAAALIALVSIGGLAAGIAMVIIARECAVSGMRIAAGAQGVVIPASPLGKIKTTSQIVAILALIAAHDAGVWWVQVLLYAAVAATLVSGADYFLNFRRKIEEARATHARERQSREVELALVRERVGADRAGQAAGRPG